MCSLILAIYDDNFLSLITKNNSDTSHSKLFYSFNNKSRILFLLRQTNIFAESYSYPDDTSSCLFDDKTVNNIYG